MLYDGKTMPTNTPDQELQPDQTQAPLDSSTGVGDNSPQPDLSYFSSEVETDNQAQPEDESLKGQTMTKPTPALMALLVIIPVIAGIGTGFGLEKLYAQTVGDQPTSRLSDGTQLQQTPSNGVKVGEIFGSPDESTFKDQAQGVLQIGGFEGEGSHRLVREGGDDQTVYLTSSITDLDEFENMEIKIWGETFKGQKVGWLMDVGRVEVIALEAELPAWAQDSADTSQDEAEEETAATGATAESGE